MAPDRGPRPPSSSSVRDSLDLSLSRPTTRPDDHNHNHNDHLNHNDDDHPDHTHRSSSHPRSDLGQYASRTTTTDPLVDSTNFTLRGILVGLVIGLIICFSNTYFGLQTGWISGMAMPASLIGFGFFRAISKHLKLPFTPVENILIQTVAGAVGTMPLALGFVGVMPALEFLLKNTEGAPLDLSLWRLVVWGLGLCLFGVVFGVPLRKQLIIREKLRFPSGTATALMISVLHGGAGGGDGAKGEILTQGTEEREELLRGGDDNVEEEGENGKTKDISEEDERANWKKQIKSLGIAFAASGFYTLVQYFIPILRDLPVFGTYASDKWVWSLNPSPAYIGQGIIMGSATTLHMLLGAVVGWGVLSPLAKNRGWAPGPVSDWESGSKGWIVWVGLTIMLADALVNLGWMILQPTMKYGPGYVRSVSHRYQHSSDWKDFLLSDGHSDYSSLSLMSGANSRRSEGPGSKDSDEPPDDAPPHHLVSNRLVTIFFFLSVLLCVICVHITFGEYIPISLNSFALFLALLLSIMGVRALGETDLNPASGISKLAQLVFAVITPTTGVHANHAIIINLLAGAVSESGAIQAGDILQDLKAGHLVGASPKAQFYGQIIGSIVGAVASAVVYKLYVGVYEIPGGQFQIPTAYVWIFTARLVTGKGLPDMAWQYSLGAGLIFAIFTVIRIWLAAGKEGSWKQKLHPWVPGGIALAVGMYNTPSFTLARTVGGLIQLYHVGWKGRSETGVTVLASGLILGEGVVSIVNLILASCKVPHL